MLKRLIKESFELWCKKCWLKQIHKELCKRDKCYQEYLRHNNIATKLMNGYDEHWEEKSGES